MAMISERELEDAGHDAILAEYMRYGPTCDRYDELEYLLECAEMAASPAGTDGVDVPRVRPTDSRFGEAPISKICRPSSE